MDDERIEMLGELKVLQKLSDYEYGVEIKVMNGLLNRNNWIYENLAEYYQTFSGVPILCAYTQNGMRIGDGHNMERRLDKNGQPYYSFTSGTAERIVGAISDDVNDISIQNIGGVDWIVAKGRLFAFYAKELVDKIIETGSMEVSAETQVHEEHTNEQGASVFTEWAGIGITILGDGVAPAVPGANIAALEQMQEEFEELKLRAASYREAQEESSDTHEGEEEVLEENYSNEGVNTMHVLNKTQMASFADKFVGWVAVCAAKDDEGKIHVGLRNDKFEFGRYVMSSAEETFAPERVEKIAVCADFGGGLTSDVSVIIDALSTENSTNIEALNAANASLAEAKETIKTMQANEDKRRVSDAKLAAKTTLEAFNANREAKIEASVLDAVNADIDNGVYTNCMKDGQWVGASEVEKTVKALCADAVLAQDKLNAERSRRSFIWETENNSAGEDDGSLKAMLNRLRNED